MTKVTYTVETPQLEVFENIPTLARANEIITECGGGTCRTTYTKVETPAPQISETRAEFLKSGKKPLHPYKGV